MRHAGELDGRCARARLEPPAHRVDVLSVKAHGFGLDVDEARRRDLAAARQRRLLREAERVQLPDAADVQQGEADFAQRHALYMLARVGAAAEKAVSLIGDNPAHVQGAAALGKLLVVHVVGGHQRRGDVHRQRFQGGRVGRRRGREPDVENRVPQRWLLEHEGARQARGKCEVGVRVVAQHVGPGQPDQIRGHVGHVAQLVHLHRRHGGEEFSVELQERDVDGRGRRRAAGFRN